MNRSTEYCFHGLHNNLYNTIVVGSGINFQLSICCFVTQYIVCYGHVLISLLLTCFLLNEIIEVHWFVGWHHLCRLRPYLPHGSQ